MNGVSKEEGARFLLQELRVSTDPVKSVLSFFEEAQRVAILEAAMVLKLGGLPALHRLFAHHGIKYE